MPGTLRQTLARRAKRVADAGRARGWLASQRDYLRFIVLGRGRSGSNLLSTSLDSHPGIVAYGEIFNNLARDKGTIHWRHPSYDPTDAQLLQLRANEPLKFIDQAVFAPMPPRINAVGFKLFYYHAQDDDWRDVWPHLLAMDVRAIHITRQDLLASLVSETIAQTTKRWSNRGTDRAGEQPPPERLTLDVDTCRTYFESITAARDTYRTYFPHTHEVTYEELAADPQRVLAGVQDFLGIEQRTLHTRLQKQGKRPPNERIENYAELKSAFAGSDWAELFP